MRILYLWKFSNTGGSSACYSHAWLEHFLQAPMRLCALTGSIQISMVLRLVQNALQERVLQLQEQANVTSALLVVILGQLDRLLAVYAQLGNLRLFQALLFVNLLSWIFLKRRLLCLLTVYHRKSILIYML
jgi:hypothetical protein